MASTVNWRESSEVHRLNGKISMNPTTCILICIVVKVVQKVSLFSPDSSLYYHQPLKHLVEVTSYTRKEEVSTLLFFWLYSMGELWWKWFSLTSKSDPVWFINWHKPIAIYLPKSPMFHGITVTFQTPNYRKISHATSNSVLRKKHVIG